MSSILAALNSIDVAVLTLVIVFVLVLCVVWAWHRDPKSPIDLQQVLLDSATNKIAIEKVGYMTALAVSTWGFTTLMLRGQMTEWYFVGYGTLFVLGRAVSTFKKGDASATPPTTNA